MELFTLPFVRFVEFWLATAAVAVMMFLMVKAAFAAEGGRTWVRRITSPNARWAFLFLFVAWAVVFGLGLQFVPHQGANSPYGGLGLIALFTGVFIMMGFLWSVIGE